MGLVDESEWSAISEGGVTGHHSDPETPARVHNCLLLVDREATEVFGATHIFCSSTGSDQQEFHILVSVTG